MSRYTVVWDPSVESQFIQAWIAGDSTVRATLTEIADWIDKDLAEGAEHKGVYRDDLNARILVVPVAESSAEVAVTFQVQQEDRQVRVVRLVFRGS